MNLWKSILALTLVIFLGTDAPTLAQTEDDPRIAQLKARFQQGVALENQGKLKEALEIFKGVVKDEPSARGSLFYAGMVSLELGAPEDAVDYLNQFRQLEPKDFKGIVLLIQANQALGRTVKVESLRKELFDLRASADIKGLSDARSYTRERIFNDKGEVIILTEFFDYKAEPNFLFMGEQKNADGDTLRRLVVFYNSDETASARAKNDKLAGVEVFDLNEEVIKDGKAAQVNVYRQEYEKPPYELARRWILDAIKEPPKPLYVAPLTP